MWTGGIRVHVVFIPWFHSLDVMFVTRSTCTKFVLCQDVCRVVMVCMMSYMSIASIDHLCRRCPCSE